MAVILNMQKLKRMHKPFPFFPAYQTWEREMILIQLQLTQLRATFERASFMLSKRDFERLDALELSQNSLQKKIKLLIQNLSAPRLRLHLARRKSLENISSEIEQGLTRLSSSLINLKNEKFANQNKVTACL